MYIPEYIQDISCAVTIGEGSASGTFIQKGSFTFVLTATHIINRRSKKKTDIQCYVTVRNKGREEIGIQTYGAKVFSYSSEKDGEDIAILLLRRKDLKFKPVKFYSRRDPPFPGVGSTVWHCGNLLGQWLQSVVRGTISAIGRLVDDVLYDQSDIGGYTGSSGGGMFTDKGEYIGMLTRGADNGGMHLFVPLRRMREWAKKRKLEWIFNPSLRIPSTKELRKVPIEDD